MTTALLRPDGTCWTCARSNCHGRISHTWGRLRWAARTARHARPETFPARLRLLWHDFVTHGLLDRGRERCQGCGRGYMPWKAPDDIYQAVVGDLGGLFCPACFHRKAKAAELPLIWAPARQGGEYDDPYGNGTLVPSDHWGRGCPDDCDTHGGQVEGAEHG